MKKYINALYVTNNGKFEIDNGYIYVADKIYNYKNLFMMKYYGLEIAGPVYIVNCDNSVLSINDR